MKVNVCTWIGFLFLTASLVAACNQSTPTKAPSTSTPTRQASTATPTPTPSPSNTAQPTLTRVRPTATRPPTQAPAPVYSCPDAPESKLAINDWVRVSVDPPLSNRIRSMPGSNEQLLGEAQPGANLLILAGPRCVDGYSWWKVRGLDGLEGWTVEGDTSGYWLVEPISVWYLLPDPIKMGKTKTYELREMRISPETNLVSAIQGGYYPLATPIPAPETTQTPMPVDPRASDFGTVEYAAHSSYKLSGAIKGFITVFDLQDPLSRYYLNSKSYDDCTRKVREILENNTLVESYLQPFCGFNMGMPTHFKVNIKIIEFSGGRGVRFLISSANYQTVNKMNYRFQGLSDDGRYYISVLIYDIAHPYITERYDKVPFIPWQEGRYEEASQSYDAFNARMKELLEAGVVPLYPSLEILDAMLASIEIKP